MLQANDIPKIGSDVSAIYMGGISLACEPAAKAYADLADQEQNNRVIMIDPNIRPGFIQDVDRYLTRLDRMIACADVVKVSDEDLNWIFPDPEALEDKVTRLRTAGIFEFVLGADGFVEHQRFIRDGVMTGLPN